jgi:6-phosphogluconolactonase (cycloisomerase 2 family)
MTRPYHLSRIVSCLLAAWFLQTPAMARLYVPISANNQVLIYPTDVSGNTGPTVTLTGASTGLSSPEGIATDANYIYVANYQNHQGAVGNSVTIYPLDASGDATPIATISGSNTGLADCTGIAVDANYIYVVNESAVGYAEGSVTVYPKTTNGSVTTGNVSPVATIGAPNGAPTNFTGFAFPEGIAVDDNYIYVASPGGGVGGVDGGEVGLFPKNANGNVAPTVDLLNSTDGLHSDYAIAVDANYLYVANIATNFYQVVLYPLAGINDSSTPTVTITGANTTLNEPSGIAVDANSIYVRNFGSNAITDFPLNASGNATPTSTLSGSNTGVSTGEFVAVDSTTFTHLSVSAPSTATAGTSFNVTVTAEDASNITVPGYSGIVAITSTDGSATLPAEATLTNGVGTFVVTLNTVGAQTVTATDTVNTSITGVSGTITVSANVAVTTTALAVSPLQDGVVIYGQPYTITATVATSPASGTVPTGTVAFSVQGNPVGSAAVNAGGQAAVTTTAIGNVVASPSAIAASYTPSSGAFAASSAVLDVPVGPASTATALVSSANPAISGLTVTFTATVTANSPSTAVPTGSVRFYVNDLSAGSVALDGSGQATYSTASLSAVAIVKAVYVPQDENFLASTSSVLVQRQAPLPTPRPLPTPKPSPTSGITPTPTPTREPTPTPRQSPTPRPSPTVSPTPVPSRAPTPTPRPTPTP